KDLFPRFKSMQGHHVARKAGWDTHGLPVEIEVEKTLNLFDHNAIEEYGIEAFVQKCRESVWKYRDQWADLTARMAYWVDMDRPYVTYHNEYIESLWWIIQQIHTAGLLYLGHKVVPFCWRCGSPLSSHEVAQNYKDVQDPSLTVAFQRTGEDEDNSFLLAWTTTPWTLPSNMALAVGAEIEYVRVRLADGREVTLAESRAAHVLGEQYHEDAIMGRMRGSALVGTQYAPLYPIPEIARIANNAHRVIAADFVSTDDGTGIVHIAPGYGEDDFKVGLQHGIPLIQRVSADGHFTPESPEFLRGHYFKDADKLVIRDLKERGLAFHQETYQHNYPFCYRHDVPLIYRATETWFIRTTAIKELLVEANKTITWVPETIGTGRFGNFLENNVDWALSRNRFWGTPLPIWTGTTTAGTAVLRVVGSLTELSTLVGRDLSDLDLHRPYIDGISFTDPEHGCEMTRVEQVCDCWFDSGAMPIAQAEWPRKKTAEGGIATGYPADFISEGVDQTRGWFYTLHALACLMHHVATRPENADNADLAPFRASPVSYKTCLVTGHVLDQAGLKMSKSKKNVVDSMEVIREFGADAMRWYFFANTDPWTPQRYYMEGVREANRQFLLTLRNVASFFATYANIDGFDPAKHMTAGTAELDRWILSRLQGTIATVTNALDRIDVLPAAQALDKFVDHLSNWWLRRSRSRFWGATKDQEKWAAYSTLYTCLTTLSRLIAPFTPFLAEELHQGLVRTADPAAPDSVHFLSWPTADAALVLPELEISMATVLQVTQLGRAARAQHQLKTRQPLPRLEVIAAHPEARTAVLAHATVIAEELNVELVEIAENPGDYVSFSAKPNFPRLGKRFGKQMQEVGKAIGALPVETVQELALGAESVTIVLAGQSEVLSTEDLELRIEAKPGFVAMMASGIGVVLDTRVTPELIRKGLAREVVHFIAEMRKTADLPYQARLIALIDTSEDLRTAIEAHRDTIMAETLMTELGFGADGAGTVTHEGEIEGQAIRVVLTVV
ncbi:MAG: isoleucine--tRNA ligase, partial [bacterium]